MRKAWIAAVVATFAGFGWMAGSVFPQDGGGDRSGPSPDKAPNAGVPAGDAGSPLDSAWVKRMTPGEAHAKLAALVGDWTVVVKFWAVANGQPLESKGKAKFRMVLGGRYLEQEFSGGFMGRDFEGRGFTGYDNETREYVSTWMDNMRTDIAHSRGTLDQEGKLSLARETSGAGGNGRLETEVMTPLGKDGFRVEYRVKEPGVAEAARVLEMTYSRDR